MQAETSITKASIKDYFENFQTIKSLIIENPPLIDSLTILSDFDNFKFVSTKKSPTKQSLNLIINDTLRVKADVESLFNLFPAKVGDVWEFDYYTLSSEREARGIGDIITEATATWKFIEVGQQIIIQEHIQGNSKLKKCGTTYNEIGQCIIIEESIPYNSVRTLASSEIFTVGGIKFYPITVLGDWAYFPIKKVLHLTTKKGEVIDGAIISSLPKRVLASRLCKQQPTYYKLRSRRDIEENFNITH